MTDTNDAPAPVEGEAPAAPAAAAPANADELASLRSRNSGLNAKVTEQQKLIEALTAERDTALKGLTDKDSADSALQRKLAEAQATIATLERTTQENALKAQYPEAYAELGETITGIAPERLAAIEARLSGTKDSGEQVPETDTPRPVGNNPQRQPETGAKPIEEQTVEELKASLRDMPREAFGLAAE